jgi:hypothetical protein
MKPRRRRGFPQVGRRSGRVGLAQLGCQFCKMSEKSRWGNAMLGSPHALPIYLELRFWITVAVGTTIADRPPHRSVQARLRIRLLPGMSSGEASIRIGMQNAGLRNPPEQERGETIPSHLCALTATN